MLQRKFLVVLVLGLAACEERMRKVGNGDGGALSSADGALSQGDTGPVPDFGFFVPDVPPAPDLSFPDVVIPDLPPPVCGNKLLEGTEACDDGNLTAGDGCSAACAVEMDDVCPTPGQPCVRNVQCGDRRQTGGEACDDGNVAAGDGCSPTCTVESGYSCARGSACKPHCGDGVIIAPEQCDDGNASSGDGCGPNCVVESGEGDGWLCPKAGQPCQRTVCGDGAIQGSEQCDDANSDTGD